MKITVSKTIEIGDAKHTETATVDFEDSYQFMPEETEREIITKRVQTVSDAVKIKAPKRRKTN